MDGKINIKGQVTLWIIVGLGIVLIVILLFFLRSELDPQIDVDLSVNPKGFIESCVRQEVDKAVDLILPQGGFAKPIHYKVYKGINVSYLCFNEGNYNPCINEHPLLLNEIRDEIDMIITPKIESCFINYKNEAEKRNSKVELGEMKLNIGLGKERIFVNIDRDLIITDETGSNKYDDFDFEIISPLYDIGRVAMEIASQEAEYCNFEHVGYMILYPRFKISIFPFSDYTKIYTIEDKKSGKEINIAIRSCAIPPGF